MSFLKSKMFTRFLTGDVSKEENEKIEKWIMNNLTSESLDEDIRSLVNEVPIIKDADRKQRVRHLLHNQIHDDNVRIRFRRWKRNSIIAGVMSAAAIISLAFVTIHVKQETQLVPSWIEVKTNYGEKKSVQLADGSIIWLHNNSHIVYPDTFVGGNRQVFVSGEVYSEIAKDKKHPFIMSTDKVNVIVKGTKFNFTSYPESEKTQLFLLEGAVDLDYTTVSGRSSISVEPGEQIEVDFQTDVVNKTKRDPSTYVNWKDTRTMFFNDITLNEIIEKLSCEFGVTVIVDSKELLKTKHYASFINNETPLEMLKAICLGRHVLVKQVNSTIYITTTNK